MSKVITFSRQFPSYHPRKGEPTHFIEKVWESIYLNGDNPIWLGENYSRITDLIPGLKTIGLHSVHAPKHHTIRAGHRFKAGDWFSPRVWSGKPYNSKQIQFAPDIQVKKTWDIERDGDGCIWVVSDNDNEGPEVLEALARNDGLTLDDLLEWFNKPMTGQIICWNDQIEY